MSDTEGDLAGPDDVDQSTVSGFNLLARLDEARERNLRQLLGRRTQPSPIRALLLRFLVIELAAGRSVTVGDCVQLCRKVRSAPNVRAELDLLEECGCLRLEGAASDRRTRRVRLTMRTTRFLNDALRDLMAEARAQLLPDL